MQIYELEKDYASIFRKIIIVLQIITIITLLVMSRAQAVPIMQGKYFLMTVTAYSDHPNCIADKHRDGQTATGIPIRKGIAAINVDYIKGKWIIKSPLNLGDEIYIEGLGNFSVEDTGYFTDTDYKQDYWNVDIYIEDYEEAVRFGRKLLKVYVIKEE